MTIPTRIQPVDLETAEHYIWGDVCDGWRLLSHSHLSIIRERVPPGTGEVKHYHIHARQFFYILSGSATLEFDTQSVPFHAGQGIHVPPGIPHRFTNTGTEDVHFLVISAPTTVGDRINVGDVV